VTLRTGSRSSHSGRQAILCGLPSRRADVTLTTALAAAVVAADLLWDRLVGSTGSLAYGLVDEPAHLATCVVALIALTALTGARPPARFVSAALIGSMAIDIDHIPGYLGWHGLAGSLPRPYTHSFVLVVVLAAVAWASRSRPARQVCLGLAFGVSSHLLRDLATGPGIPVGWPLVGGAARVPYIYLASLLALAPLAVALPRQARPAAKFGLATLVVGLALSATAIAAPSADARVVSVGAFIPGADNNPSLIDEFSRQVGRQATTVIVYKDWTQAPFVYSQLDGIWNQGAAPVITWEPWDVSLGQIANGSEDQYIHDAARAAAGWNRPLFVRFAQEMNGTWFPWSGDPDAYKAAWRHIVRIFREAGADKVRWVWNPYTEGGPGQHPFSRYFPGGRWVDWAGLDALNWGGSFSWSTFRGIVGSSYHRMLRLTQKPIMIGEVGSGEQGGSKARWLDAMLRRSVPHMRHVRSISFWSVDDSRGDLRVDSSATALAAVRRALADPLYKGSRQALLGTPLRLTH
jgi:membrane-bound metal-dependent hydrolase YbcI (DUF457 family)